MSKLQMHLPNLPLLCDFKSSTYLKPNFLIVPFSTEVRDQFSKFIKVQGKKSIS